MAHFLTLVIVSPDQPDPAGVAHSLMWPYFEGSMYDDPGPNNKCDGFVIGGQYDGEIWGKEQHYNLTPEEYNRRYGLDVVKPEDNIRPIREIVPDFVPYAIVMPDGSWRDREHRDYEEWKAEVADIFREYADWTAVAIDCHC
jgi:hypothetical protein